MRKQKIIKKVNQNNQPSLELRRIFWSLVGLAVIIVGVIFINTLRKVAGLSTLSGAAFLIFLLVFGIAFFLLGLAIIFMTRREKVTGRLKIYLILTGASAAGFFASVILHNFVYALFIFWFGSNFWERVGLGDEPFFFILAIYVCPTVFLVGVIGGAVKLKKLTANS